MHYIGALKKIYEHTKFMSEKTKVKQISKKPAVNSFGNIFVIEIVIRKTII